MTQLAPVVFLLDVDNTLLDNDRIGADLKRHLTQAFGAERQERYWAISEKLRMELGYADSLGALQRYRAENPRDPNFLQIFFYLLDYPFANRLFPGSLDVIERLRTWGPTIVLSDGDVVFRPRKVERSGLFEAVEGRVLLYIHKEQELDNVEKHHSACHYVLVDDKLRILTARSKVPEALRDQLGIAIAKRTYRAYRGLPDSPSWQPILNAGAHPQRLLWASTSTKDPGASDVLYIKSLAAPFTVNTMPVGTLKALADRGEVGPLLPVGGGDCEEVLATFAKAGIDIEALAAQLQDEGARSFVDSWNELMECVASKSEALKKAG